MQAHYKMRKLKVGVKLKTLGLACTPIFLFLMLLFSEPIALFAWVENDGKELNSDKEYSPKKQFDYINIQIDSTLSYEPSLIKAGLIYDYTENRLVWEKNLEEQFPIASLTKMMVALITMEHIEAKKVSLDDIVTISKYATWVGGSKVYIKEGQKLSVSDLLQAAMIRSGNDAAYALAEHVGGGTEEVFVQLMNKKCESLGMDYTCFANSTGMPVRSKGLSDNESTAGDLLLLARELVKYESILDMTSRSTEKIQNANGLYTYDNRNTLVKKYDEIDGLKTGFTNAAKYCIVATSKRCDHRVITILLGVGNKRNRYNIAVNLFNNYYSSIGLGNLGEDFDETASSN
ncbi:MAG: D-alanyl-D-alanine carboxypeptidase (penicillin-binding protein 5/6) [Bacteroidia bacterium]|jgi:D-alanyl-D-alanine carboxypeptidase (penicillin-binding protein 5/6)